MQSATVAAPTADTAASLAWDDDLVGPSPETLMALAGLTRVREGLKEPRPTVDAEQAATDTALAEPPSSRSPLPEVQPQPQPQLPPQLSEDEIVRALAAATAVDADADEGPAPDLLDALGASSIDFNLAVPPPAPVTVAAPAHIEAEERPPMIIEKAQAEYYGMEAPIQPIRFRALNPVPGFAVGVTLSVAAGALLFLALAPA